MPSIVELLLETAKADTELLIKNDGLGDTFATPRNVDFLFVAPSREKAEIVASFINDNRYANATVSEVGNSFRVLVVVNMPITQHLLYSVSGLMACIGKIFDVKYDGWGSAIQRVTNE